MSESPPVNETLELERYELFAAPVYRFDFELQRRDFFKLLGGGLVLVFTLDALASQESGRQQGESGRRATGGSTPKDIAGWLHIGEDGLVTVFTGKVEFGQNIRTSLSQVVAEELRIPPSSLHVLMGDTDLTPFDIGTFGSRTIPTMAPQLRKAAAAAREVLIDLAAEHWKIGRAAIGVRDGKVIDEKTDKSLEFGRLTKGQKLLKVISDDAPTTSADRWKVAGKSVAKVDGTAFVTGKHRYTSDLKQPGMLVGRVVRPSSFNATLVSAETREAEAITGVAVVRDGDFIGVAAPDAHTAARAAGAIKVEWKAAPQPSANGLFDYLRQQATSSQAVGAQGSIADGLIKADKKLNQTYAVAYIAHAPLVPRAAIAEWRDGKLTVWTGTQRPFGVRGELAEAFRIPEDRVRVIVPDTGAGYGGKHTGEAAVEAARLAKAADKPVKVVWTREEEFTWAYFRPAGVIDVSSGVRDDGIITAWEFHNYNSGTAGIQTKYDLPNQKFVFHQGKSPLRQGSYRGLAATANHFARETHIDELAHLLKMDPLELRLKNLKDERLRAVLVATADAFGWGKSRSAPDHGYGIAGGFEKGGYVATCAEVAVDRATGKLKLLRVVEGFECGAIVNPDHLKNQIEGSIVMGIGGALFEAVDFDNGKVVNGRFSRYRLPRFSDVPAIETVLIDRKDLPSAGAGETPIVGIAPAVGSAIFDATGLRLRSLPLAPSGLKFAKT
jgi:nicotinate dehydrogenase subunit B